MNWDGTVHLTRHGGHYSPTPRAGPGGEISSFGPVGSAPGVNSRARPAPAVSLARMKLMLRILAGLAVFVVALVVAAYLLPRHYRVERSTVINAPVAKIFPRVADMRGWKGWTVWHERDPNIKNDYSPEQGVVGAWSAWESKKEGNGRATLTAIETGQRLVYRLEFPDLGMVSTGTFVFAAEGNATKVTWSDEGDLGMNPMSRWFGLFLDKMLGADFEAGLAKLKRTTEK